MKQLKYRGTWGTSIKITVPRRSIKIYNDRDKLVRRRRSKVAKISWSSSWGRKGGRNLSIQLDSAIFFRRELHWLRRTLITIREDCSNSTSLVPFSRSWPCSTSSCKRHSETGLHGKGELVPTSLPVLPLSWRRSVPQKIALPELEVDPEEIYYGHLRTLTRAFFSFHHRDRAVSYRCRCDFNVFRPFRGSFTRDHGKRIEFLWKIRFLFQRLTKSKVFRILCIKNHPLHGCTIRLGPFCTQSLTKVFAPPHKKAISLWNWLRRYEDSPPGFGCTRFITRCIRV